MGLKSKGKINSGEGVGEETMSVESVETANTAAGQEGVAGHEAAVDQKGAAGDEVAALKAEVLDLKDKYLRSLADFENLRKRAAKERSELIKYQGESILVDILEVVDSFERALENPGSDLEKFKEGVRLIHRQFVDVLGKWDVRGESAIGKDFDPNLYRAIGKAKIEGQKPNAIIGELKKTYLYKDKLLRIGEVMVNEGPSEEAGATAATEGEAHEVS